MMLHPNPEIAAAIKATLTQFGHLGAGTDSAIERLVWTLREDPTAVDDYAEAEPSGLINLYAQRMPPELLAVEGASWVLNVIAGNWDDGDEFGSAMSVGFAVCEALTALEADVPNELQYSPGAWDGTLELADLYSGAAGEHQLTIELLQVADQNRDTAIAQFTNIALATSAIIDRARAAGDDY